MAIPISYADHSDGTSDPVYPGEVSDQTHDDTPPPLANTPEPPETSTQPTYHPMLDRERFTGHPLRIQLEVMFTSALALNSALHIEIWNNLVTNHSEQMNHAALLTMTNTMTDINDQTEALTQDIQNRIDTLTSLLNLAHVPPENVNPQNS